MCKVHVHHHVCINWYLYTWYASIDRYTFCVSLRIVWVICITTNDCILVPYVGIGGRKAQSWLRFWYLHIGLFYVIIQVSLIFRFMATVYVHVRVVYVVPLTRHGKDACTWPPSFSDTYMTCTVVSRASAHSRVLLNAYVPHFKGVSAHAGQNHELCLSTHGCLPGVLQ